MNLMFWRRNGNSSASTPEELMHELLSSYMDGELTPAEQVEVESLIVDDPEARELLEDLSLLTSALGGLGAEVRAPRSFAIPAPAAADGTPTAPLAMFQRVELFFRASAAVAALLFVVVLVNDSTGETPIAAPMAAPSASMAEPGAGSAEAFMLPPEAPPSPDGAPTLAPAAGLIPAEGTPESEDGGMGALAMPAEDDPDTAEDAEVMPAAAVEPGPADTSRTAPVEPPAVATDTLASPTALEPTPDSGTFLAPPSSDGVGGVAPALGTIAGLLTALSAILAWDRRTRERRHRTGD